MIDSAARDLEHSIHFVRCLSRDAVCLTDLLAAGSCNVAFFSTVVALCSSEAAGTCCMSALATVA